MLSRLTVVLVSLLLATPAVIFWLWLVILPARVAKLCPEECRCDSRGYNVDCSGSGLNNIPLVFPTDVRELVLNRNNITSLQKDSFISRGLTELEVLRANKCHLSTIELGAFNGLIKLTDLSVLGNEISEIIPRTFEKLSRLENLDLAYNTLEHLESDAFCGMVNLKHIYLNGNKLQYVHPDVLVGLSSLKSLYLSNNSGLRIPTDRHFINSHSLSRLDIADCNISSVSVETLANVSALEWLDLSNNNLRIVDINILKVLPKLSALYLYGNRLTCDCQLQEVWRWCQDHNIQTASGETAPECDTPSEVQGILWGVLEKGQCLQGNIYYYGDYENTSYSYTPIEDTDLNEYVSGVLKHYEALVYAVLFIFGTAGNAILLIIIICNKDMQYVPNMYILNLAISGMIYLAVRFSEACADRISATWKYGDFTCMFFRFYTSLSVGVTAYSVAVLSIQQYNVAANLFHNQIASISKRRPAVATICGVWIVAALFALPSALSEHVCYACWTYRGEIYFRRVVLFELLVSCVLPLCFIAFFYIMMARYVAKSARCLSEFSQSPLANRRKSNISCVLTLTVVFVISHVPYHAFWTYKVVNDKAWLNDNNQQKLQTACFLLTCLLLMNPCLNPLALCCTRPDFRKHFKRYLSCRFKANSLLTNLELGKRN